MNLNYIYIFASHINMANLCKVLLRCEVEVIIPVVEAKLLLFEHCIVPTKIATFLQFYLKDNTAGLYFRLGPYGTYSWKGTLTLNYSQLKLIVNDDPKIVSAFELIYPDGIVSGIHNEKKLIKLYESILEAYVQDENCEETLSQLVNYRDNEDDQDDDERENIKTELIRNPSHVQILNFAHQLIYNTNETKYNKFDINDIDDYISLLEDFNDELSRQYDD
jgi:hypothetical protein